jgi:hypothetical protein
MKNKSLGFTLTAAIALAIASVSSAQEIVERVQVQAGETPVTITTYAPTIDAVSIAGKAVLPIERYGDSTAYVTWESGGYLYHFVDSKNGRVYAVSLNVGEQLDSLSKLVGVALNNPIVIPAIEYQAKDVSVSAKAAPPAGWGRVLATYRGVDAYFNGPDPNYINGQSQYGYRWHCVEYVFNNTEITQGACGVKFTSRET